MQRLDAYCRQHGLRLGLDNLALTVWDADRLVDDIVLNRRRGNPIPVEIAASMLLANLQGERFYP